MAGFAHHFTVDVEEHFQVSAFEPHVEPSAWERMESRVCGNVERLLNLLDLNEARATFFMLGWIAHRHPHLARAIAARGHEIASHGWDHRRVTEQSPDEFRDSARRSRDLLEDQTGNQVFGFRAPSFSIVPGCEWALDVLIEEGYRYDSSLFPIRRHGYGYPNGGRDPHWLQRAGGRLAEVPPATLRRWGLNVPAGGGGYFRLLPYGVVRATLAEYERREVPATFYIHPWEVDPGQPKLEVSFLAALRHYTGLERAGRRLQRLLSEFRFRPIIDTVGAL